MIAFKQVLLYTYSDMRSMVN